MSAGKCPKCDAPIERLVISRVPAGADSGGSTYAAMTLQCPACTAVLGAQLERTFDSAGIHARGAREGHGPTNH